LTIRKFILRQKAEHGPTSSAQQYKCATQQAMP